MSVTASGERASWAYRASSTTATPGRRDDARTRIDTWLDEVYRLDTAGYSGAPQAWPEDLVVAASRRTLTTFKERSGLTWDQVARTMGVSTRAVLHWQAGKPMSPHHEERLAALSAELDKLDTGHPSATRAILMRLDDSGTAPFQRWLSHHRRPDAERAWIDRQPT
jgi:transcriptional regulator with XRE-family HTH domain